MIRALLIAGPTASGKSAVALALAKLLGGRIVNADSMQVYRDLRILTARPTQQEEAGAPHRLFGHVDGAINYSVGRFLEDVTPLLDTLRQDGFLPIITGGTGLYFGALLHGLSDIPAVPDAVRQRVRQEAEGLPPSALHARLAAHDSTMAARLRPSDPQRILRALEVWEATGQSLADFLGRRTPPLLQAEDCVSLFLLPERSKLFARIDARFDAMIDAGALDEVTRLADRDLDPTLPVMRAHGVPGLIAYLRGETTREAALERGKRDTRHYAKRQETFVRHQLPEFTHVSPEDAEAAAMQRVEDYARGR